MTLWRCDLLNLSHPTKTALYSYENLYLQYHVRFWWENGVFGTNMSVTHFVHKRMRKDAINVFKHN